MKAYVVDTTALLYEPEMIYKMGLDDTVVIPTAVIKELDACKRSEEELKARAARDFARTLDQLGSYQNLAAGARLKTGTILRTCTAFERIRDFESDIDNRIVGAALKLKGEYGYVAVVSRDREMRDVARAKGLRAKNWPLSLTRLDKAAPVASDKVKTMEIHRPLRNEGLLRRLFRLLMAAFLKSGEGSSALSCKGGRR